MSTPLVVTHLCALFHEGTGQPLSKSPVCVQRVGSATGAPSSSD